MLLLFAQGSSPEYITVELAAIARLSSCFKFGAGGGAGTKRLPRRVLRQRLPAARPYQGPRATIGAASVSQSYIGTSLENYNQQARLSLVSASTMQGAD